MTRRAGGARNRVLGGGRIIHALQCWVQEGRRASFRSHAGIFGACLLSILIANFVFCTSTFRNLNRKPLVRRHLLCDRAVTIDEGGQACCQDAGQAAMGEPYAGFLFEPTLRGKGICKVMKLAPQFIGVWQQEPKFITGTKTGTAGLPARRPTPRPASIRHRRRGRRRRPRRS